MLQNSTQNVPSDIARQRETLRPIGRDFSFDHRVGVWKNILIIFMDYSFCIFYNTLYPKFMIVLSILYSLFILTCKSFLFSCDPLLTPQPNSKKKRIRIRFKKEFPRNNLVILSTQIVLPWRLLLSYDTIYSQILFWRFFLAHPLLTNYSFGFYLEDLFFKSSRRADFWSWKFSTRGFLKILGRISSGTRLCRFGIVSLLLQHHLRLFLIQLLRL